MSYSIERADPARDRDIVLELWQRNLALANAERYRWLYEGGPGVAWIARTEQGAAVGSTGLMMRKVWIAGQPHDVGQAVDLNVDVAHRSLGLALQLERTVLAEADGRGLAFLYALPVKQAAPVFKRLGFQELGPINRWNLLLSSEHKIRAYVKFRLISRPLSWLVDPWLPGHSRTQPGLPIQAREQARFDGDFDRLTAAATKRFSMLGDRGAEYLSWRLAQKRQDLRVVVALGPQEELGAYLAYARDGQGVVRISDFLYMNDESAEFLMTTFAHQMRREGVQSIQLSFLGSPAVTTLLRGLGFLCRSSGETLYVHRLVSEPGRKSPELGDPASWFFTRADLDTDG